MADNPTSAAPSKPEGSNEAHGNKRARSPGSDGRNHSDKRGRGDRGRGDRGRGRGDRGRGRGRGRGGDFGANKSGGRSKKGEMGRGEWNRTDLGRRKRDDENQDGKRQRTGEAGDYASTQFSKEEIEADGRKPKRKVAVLIGYAGSGYKGMQINTQEKTIEGDIFKAFVAAGAISKANADDPKKSSLVRCARTDKGVHAAGNVISLKLIVEDPEIVQKINDNLPPQIRIWGMERTNASFSCYQTCDSRWYEYLIPTFAFVPPHPKSYMGKKLVEHAEKEGVLEAWKARQADVADFWEKADEEFIKPILDELDPELREAVMAEVHATEDLPEGTKKKSKAAKSKEAAASAKEQGETTKAEPENHPDAMEEDPMPQDESKPEENGTSGEAKSTPSNEQKVETDLGKEEATVLTIGEETLLASAQDGNATTSEPEALDTTTSEPAPSKSILTPHEAAVKRIKAAYIVAKKAYRISAPRKARVQEALSTYIGTRNFHNYTIQKLFSDPSAKRVIRSFTVGADPVYINSTEWLSLKVHGQSFMMHQIRKMVAMVALVVRCGTDLSVMTDSFGHAPISIPKAPGLGLLLERPVFDSYNEQAVSKFEREKIDFDKWKAEMEEFKQREIYDRIFREEERDHQFHAFFHHIDCFRSDFFLWVTAGGLAAAKQSKVRNEFLDLDEGASDNEVDADGREG
ncbi:tRNA pseudouridine synthase [Lachnellula subtilissima]|uniref:tRNA pseudouridine synthase 1 n=1 Tax=Lachnellula subtilissima TaxID=602034 RepID=A0A8H8RJ18_9HELO|nr:tRNA pseudouridine synthase [Lachnellula subtilissima]